MSFRLFNLLQFERRQEPIAPRAVFHGRIYKSIGLAAALLTGWWAIGAVGYHEFVRVPGWLNSIYSAAMIVGGMGPVDFIQPSELSAAGRWFASFYAVISGVVLLASVGLMLTPPLHRLLHRFHIAEEDEESGRR